MKNKLIGWLGLALIFSTILWIVLLIISESIFSSGTLLSTIESIKQNLVIYKVIYLNAAFLTLLTIAFFSLLYLEAKQVNPQWAIIGFAFIIIYGVLNLLSYLSQVFVIPSLLEIFYQVDSQEIVTTLLKLSIHTLPNSAIAILNALAYGILGIPLIIFPMICMKQPKSLAFGGKMFILSGSLSIFAIGGYILSIEVVNNLFVLSGGVYLIALLPITKHYLSNNNMVT